MMKQNKNSDYIKYRNGKWLQSRKRIYLYWYKYLQLAQSDDKLEVDWSKYRGWGGSRAVVNQKFDIWWEERWEKLFGITERIDKPKFPLSTRQPKANGIRLDLLAYEHRHLPNNLEIAEAVRQYEKERGRDIIKTFKMETVDDPRMTQSVIGRSMRRAKQRLRNVCDGKFP